MHRKILLCLAIAMACTLNSGEDTRRFEIEICYHIVTEGTVSRIKFISLIPKTIENRQKILGISYSINPERIFDDEEERYTEFIIENPQKEFDLRIKIDVEIVRYDFSIAKRRKTEDSLNEESAKYLASERYIEKDDVSIKQIAEKMTGGDDEEITRKISDFVTKELRYSGRYVIEDLGAVRALEKKSGDCTDFTDLFVALCRAKNIPARYVEGYLICDLSAGDTPKHDWAEVYFEGKGWIPFDLLWSHLNKASFDRLGNVYVYYSKKRNDSILNNYHFWAYWYWGGNSVKVTDSFKFKQE